MNSKNPHKPLRSSWRSEVFTAPKTRGVIIINQSRGRNTPQATFKLGNTKIGTSSQAGYQY